MADHLVFSLQPSPFLIFPCSLHRQWNFSRRFPGGIGFSVPDHRQSSQLQLVNSTSPSQSLSLSSSSSFPPADSAPEKFDLVSSTQLKDGSHIFRFGDASEIERNLETEAKVRFAEVEKQDAKIAEKASKQGEKDGHTLVDFNRVSELEDRKEKSDSKTKSGHFKIETGSEKEESAAPSSLSNVIKIKDRRKARSPTKKKKETSASVIVSRNEEKVEAKISSVPDLSSIVSVAEANPPSSTEEKVEGKISSVSNLSSIASIAEFNPPSSTVEKVVISGNSEPIKENEITVESYNVEPLSSEVMEKGSVSELREVMEKGSVNDLRDSETNGYQQITENHTEVQEKPSPSTSEHGSLSNDVEEVAHVSTIELDDNLDAMINLMKTFEAEENLSVEPTVTAVVSSDELISISEATHHSVDVIAETPVIDTSEAMSPEVNDGEKAASAIEDEITVSDTKTDDGNIISITVNDTRDEDLQISAPEIPVLESIEVASGREELVSKAFYLDSGFTSLQSPFKALAGREDAYFVSHNNWLGIADGVSQWSFEGINKGIYAQELMSNCEKIISDENTKITDPVQVLHRSVDETKSPGSSTALIAHLENNELHVANIGDSGFMVIRNGTVLQRSSPMFHHFCFPLQITQGDDVLKLAEVYHVNLEEGDVVVTATDGLFDNLYEKEIVSIICRSLEQSLEPQKIAELVAAKAQEVGRSGSEKTPFAETAKEEGYNGYRGGKLDAVTVIVSLVQTLSV